nr:hypothetical protein [Tanacetum cinerariifolium]
MELEPEIKVPGLEYNRSLPEGVPYVNNMVIEEPKFSCVIPTNGLNDQTQENVRDSLAYLKLSLGSSIYRVWKQVDTPYRAMWDTAYWGFLGVRTMFVILQNPRTDTPYLLDGYGVLRWWRTDVVVTVVVVRAVVSGGGDDVGMILGGVGWRVDDDSFGVAVVATAIVAAEP